MTEQPLAQQLARLVVDAFNAVGLTQADILSGPIEYTELPWQIPPLVVKAPLFKVPFCDYYSSDVGFLNTEALHNLWSEGMYNLKNKPFHVVNEEGYRRVSYALPKVRQAERQLYLSLPDGYPHAVSIHAGVTLSMEVAHLVKVNAKLEEFVEDDSNYYGVLADSGLIMGVKDGLPCVGAEIWDISVEGMIPDLLTTPRGSLWEGCDYDIIAKVRSVLTQYQKHFREYEGVDWALQTLRVIGGATELLNAVRRIKQAAHTRKARADLLTQAVEAAHRVSLTDRQRIEILKALLVPEIISAGQFSRFIYPYYQTPPPILQDKVVARIQAKVQELYQAEEDLYKLALPTKE